MAIDAEEPLPTWLIYGANGYTGRLIAAEAVNRGLEPVLAGRNAEAIRELAKELGCQFCSFDLGGSADVSSYLKDVSLVLNCAGPFSQTAKPMIDACLASGTSYLDITGEIDVIELAAARHAEASKAGVTLMPAVGFDVVPSDCLAATVAQALERPISLQLAFAAGWSISPGTAKTILESAGSGGRIRRDGKIIRVPAAYKTAEIPFADRPRLAVTIPWGDVSSAYHSTGIPNIEVYCAQPRSTIRMMRLTRWAEPLVRSRLVQRLGNWWINCKVAGPSDEDRRTTRTQFWARATDEDGSIAEATLETPDGYTATVNTSLGVVQRVLRREVSPGFFTTSMAFGASYIESFPSGSPQKKWTVHRC